MRRGAAVARFCVSLRARKKACSWRTRPAMVRVGLLARYALSAPPAGDLTHAAAQGPKAHGGTAKPLVQPGDRPRLGLGKQPADAVGEPAAAQAWPARSG